MTARRAAAAPPRCAKEATGPRLIRRRTHPPTTSVRPSRSQARAPPVQQERGRKGQRLKLRARALSAGRGPRQGRPPRTGPRLSEVQGVRPGGPAAAGPRQASGSNKQGGGGGVACRGAHSVRKDGVGGGGGAAALVGEDRKDGGGGGAVEQAAGEERGRDAGNDGPGLQRRHSPAAGRRRQRELRHIRREERAEWAAFPIVAVATDVERADAIQDEDPVPGGSR